MTHLRIELNNVQENVNSAVIEKLYELAISGDLDLSSNLAGNLHTTITYLEYIDAITGKFPDLIISTNNTYIMFEDPEVLRILKDTSAGDGVGVIRSSFLSLTSIPQNLFYLNQSLTKFNELSLATNCRTIESNAFMECNNLQEIDISNILTVGEGCFKNSNISGEIVLNNVLSIGNNAFDNTNVTSVKITSNGNNIISSYAFQNCSNLRKVDLSGINGTLLNRGQRLFYDCLNIEELILSESVREYSTLWISGSDKKIKRLIGTKNITNLGSNTVLSPSQLETPVCFSTTDLCCIRSLNRNSVILNGLFLPKFTTLTKTRGLFYSTPEVTSFTYRSQNNGSIQFGILYFKDLQSITLGAFYCTHIQNLVINTPTPPTFDTTDYNNIESSIQSWWDVWEQEPFYTGSGYGSCNIDTLWVPDSAVSTYLANPYYSKFTIKGINEKDANDEYLLPRFATFADWDAAATIAKQNNQDLPIALIEEFMV